MRRGLRKSLRQSQPGSLERLQRGIKHTVHGIEDQPETVNCLDMRTGQRLMVSESAVYAATFNSFHTLYGKPQSVIMRELLNDGAVLANSKGIFWLPRRKSIQPARRAA
jgi:hypothetical protein